MFKNWKGTRIVMALILALSLAGGGLLLAGKGGNKGGGQGGGGGGEPPPDPDPAVTFATQGELWIMNQDGSNLVKLVADADAATSNWSPDGTKIVFANFGNNTSLSGNGIYIVDLVGTLEQLVDSPSPTWADTPAWSPAGDEIAYAWAEDANVDVDPGQIRAIDAAGTITVLYDFPDGFPIMGGLSWSPDATRLTVHISDELLNESFVGVLDTTSGNLVDVTPGFVHVHNRSIEWARLSNQIAFVGTLADDTDEALWILDLDEPVNSPDRFRKLLSQPKNASLWSPSWSPDDTTLIFRTSGTRKLTGLWLIDVQSGADALLLKGSHWWPDWRR